MTVQIKFCGAAGTVTGSCYWIKTDSCEFLVDCGLFQGSKTIKELNYRPLPFDVEKIDFALLTHAHTDHTALVPKLTKAGFDGPIYTTLATRDLVRYMLPDSGYIQEFEVERLNWRNRQRGRPEVEPIYTRKDAEMSVHQIRTLDYEEWLEPSEDVRVRFWNAGHILGSASIEIEILDGKKWMRLLFSGDLGPDHKLFHGVPDAPKDFDYVFCESTYGGRTRDDVSVTDRRSILAREINDAMARKGNLVIPSFAVERSQELLLDIAYLFWHDTIPCTSVFLDSPLAIKITSVFSDHAKELQNTEGDSMPFAHPRFHFTETVEESKSIARFSGGVIIMAASGMCDAGRIRHHLKNHLWRPESTVLLVGYQAEGTLGSLLESGIKSVKIQGEAIQVRARIRKIDVYSGHADGDGLLDWVKDRAPIRRGLFLTHGSPESLNSMRESLINDGFPAGKIITPALDDEFKLCTSGKTTKIQAVQRRLEADVLNKPDWHNDLAQLSLDIRKSLDESPDDKHRAKILKQLQKIIKPDSKKEI